MAARDRFGALGEPGLSPLQRYIQSACDPTNYEPNLALNLEIADLINSKKGNAPREAAVATVNYINHRNQNVSLLALTLLDICVKNCGYPFHLQISTKEFLNELVRRFPERPPIRPNRTQLKILEEIEEWRQTICETSRYKEDLGYIRDMHRLLSYKGYMFPEIRREDAAVLNPSDNLQSAEEMEEEEKAAQSAKLQELIRRGGPEDLQEANRLMKVMAGYDNKHKTDYRAKAAEEVGKVQQKAKILEEMLQGFKPGDMSTEGDVFDELANALQNAQPKIQRMCGEEELVDPEAVAKLLEINDSIHRTIERYKLVKKGDLEGASKIPRGTLGSKTGVGKTGDNELSLIDFDSGDLGETSGNANGQAISAESENSSQKKVDSLQDDLLGLSFQDQNFGQGGGISLGLGSTQGASGSGFPSSTSQNNTAALASPSIAPVAPISGSSTPSQQQQPNYSAYASSFVSQPSSKSHTPTPSFQQFVPPTQAPPQPQPQASQPPQQKPASQPASDPFASLHSSGFGSSPPVIQQPRLPSSTSASSDLFSLAPDSTPSQAPAGASQPSNTDTGDADEWTFASSLPPSSSLPTQNQVDVSSSTVGIVLEATRTATTDGSPSVAIIAYFSNNDSRPISSLTFQTAVPKGYTLKLQPQSGQSLTPQQRNGITQSMQLHGVEPGKGNSVKIRWRLSYSIAGESKQEQGEIPSLGIA